MTHIISHVLLAAVGLSVAIKTSVVGNLYGTDLLCLALLPVVLARGPSPQVFKRLLPYLGLLFAWLASAILTDIVRSTPPVDFMRGWAKIAMLGVCVAVVGLLVEDRLNRLMTYFASLAVGMALAAWLDPTAYQTAAPWKFGYAIPVALLVCIAASGAKLHPGLRIVLPMTLGAISLFLDFRSLFAVLLATGLTPLLFYSIQAISRSTRAPKALTLAFVLVFGGVVGTGTYLIYTHLASEGLLGRDAQAKLAAQSQGELGLILNGRSESLASIQAIGASPVLGHGSWAKDRYYVAQRILMLRQRGVDARDESRGVQSELIPSHSYILGAWVESGIVGGFFWAFVGLAILRAFFSLAELNLAATPFLAFILIKTLWDIPFSPFGADARFHVAGVLCATAWLLSRRTPGASGSAANAATAGHRQRS